MKKSKSIPEAQFLRVLILEDEPADAELIQRELRRAQIEFTPHLTKTRGGFIRALETFRPQVILTDFKLPGFDGLTALDIAREKAPDIPFLFVSGSIGEEKAIETLSLGAADYIFKDNLQRLGPAVKRVVEASHLKREKEKTDEELRQRLEELRILAEAADRFVHINDLDKIYDYLAQAIRAISGADYLLLSLYDETLQAVRPKVLAGFEPYALAIRRRLGIDPAGMIIFLKEMQANDFADFVSRRLRPVRDGLYGLANRTLPRAACRFIESTMGIMEMYTMGFSWENQLYGGVTVFFKKGNLLKNSAQVEALVNLAAVALKRLLVEKSLRASEERYRRISETMSDIDYSCHLGPDGTFSLTWITGATDQITGYTIEEISALRCWGKLVLPEDFPDFEKYVTGLTPGNNGICELRLRHKDGSIVWVQSFAKCTPGSEHPEHSILHGALVDISERKQIETALRESREYYRTLVNTSPDAIIIVDGGARVTFASSKTREIFGIPALAEMQGLSITEFVEPEDIPKVQERLVEILSGQARPEIRTYRLRRHDRRPFWGEISSSPLRDAAGRSIGLLLVCRDISERMLMETERQALQEIMQGLATTDNLQDFLKNVHTSIAKVITAENFFVALYNKDTTLFEEAYSIDKFDLPAHPSKLEKSISRYVFRSGQPLLLTQEYFDELAARGEVDLVGTNSASWLGVPLKTSSETVGVMVVQDYEKDNRYSERDLDFLVSIAGQVAQVVERKRSEEEVRTSQQLLKKVLSSLLDAVFIIDANTVEIIDCNPAASAIFGYTREEMVGKTTTFLHVDQSTLDEFRQYLNSAVEEKGFLFLPDYRMRRKNASIFPTEHSVIPILDEKGKRTGWVSMIRDITERKRAEEEMKKLAAVVQHSSELVNLATLEGKMIFLNEAGSKMLGIDPDKIGEHFILEVISESFLPKVNQTLLPLLLSGKTWEGELQYRNLRTGRLTDVHTMAFTIKDPDSGASLYLANVSRNITDYKLAEEQIQVALKEKEVLLQEIHHRVKNNLQIISGLLTLQADQAAGKSVQDIFRESQDRIRSIALIHEKLYKSNNLAEIAFDDYLRTLTENLFISQGIVAGRITVTYEMEPMFFSIEKAIPLGLIANELLTNALKHAFPVGRQGEIRIALQECRGTASCAPDEETDVQHAKGKAPGRGTARLVPERGRAPTDGKNVPSCELIVADNGIGLPAGFKADTQKSLGMHLVSMLAQQIQAELKVKTGPGTEFRLLFSGLPANKAGKDKDHDS